MFWNGTFQVNNTYGTLANHNQHITILTTAHILHYPFKVDVFVYLIAVVLSCQMSFTESFEARCTNVCNCILNNWKYSNYLIGTFALAVYVYHYILFPHQLDVPAAAVKTVKIDVAGETSPIIINKQRKLTFAKACAKTNTYYIRFKYSV